MFNGLHSEDEGAADHKPRAYCASVYGLFCFVGTFTVPWWPCFLSTGLCISSQRYAISQSVSSLSGFSLKRWTKAQKTLQRLSHRAQLLMALPLVPNVAYLFVI